MGTGVSKLVNVVSSSFSSFTSEQVIVPSSVANNQDLVREILTKLPFKSVARFRCVSKEWFAFLNQIRLSNPKLIYTHSVEIGLHRHEFSLLGRDAKTLSRVDSPEIVLDGSFKSIYIAGSSNGLVCLQLLEDKTQRELIIIWNPVTKQYRELPESLCFEVEKKEEMYAPLVGFGCIKGRHGARDINYKVVRISPSNNSRLVIQVFTRRVKSWRVINHTNLSNCMSYKSGSVTLNGVLYFLASYSTSSGWSLCSFNLHDEVTHNIPVLTTIDKNLLIDFSSGIGSCVYIGNNLFAWNDLVATYAKKRPDDGNSRQPYDVWVMTTNWKWTKQGTIKHPDGWYYKQPYGVWNNLLILDKRLRTPSAGGSEQCLCTYDLTNQKESTILIRPEAVKSESRRQVVNFVESQLSV